MQRTKQRAPNWEPAWCSKNQLWFFQDRVNGVSTWDRPANCTIVLPSEKPADVGRPDLAAEEQSLPAGWEVGFDDVKKKLYYFNRATEKRTWKRPGGGPADCPGIQGGVPESRGGSGRQVAGSSSGYSTALASNHIQDRGRSPPSETVLGWNAQDFVARLREARNGAKNQYAAKSVLREVSENNYVNRKRWRVPRTIPVPYKRGMASTIPTLGRNPQVFFADLTTAEALLRLGNARKGLVCGLSFANGSQVGGGYKSGATAQEEDLCRRMPSLYTSLNNANRDGIYPFGPSTCKTVAAPCKYSDVLWTPDVAIARADEANGYAWLPDRDQAFVCLVSAAAPNINFAKPPEINDREMICNTIRTILAAPRLMRPEIDTIILGAWGCGAFGGDPEVLSELFFRVLFEEKLGQLYENIYFAIPRFSNEDRIPDIFRDVFSSHRVPIRMLQ